MCCCFWISETLFSVDSIIFLHIQIYGWPEGMHFSKACMIHSMQLKLEGNMCVLFLFVCSYKRFRIAAMHSYSLSSKRTRTYRISHWRFFHGWYHSTPHLNPPFLWFDDSKGSLLQPPNKKKGNDGKDVKILRSNDNEMKTNHSDWCALYKMTARCLFFLAFAYKYFL